MDLILLAEQSFSWGSPSSWGAIAMMLAGLSFVVFVHELGHFLVAKACGVKCEKFYVGFDAFDVKIGDTVIIPRTLLKKKWGETEYGIGILPLGGYVKMLGQDDNPANASEELERATIEVDDDMTGSTRREHDPRSYLAKSVWQRMAIISAGVVMNLIFAVLFAAVAYWNGVEYQPTVVGSTVPGGPAWSRNIRPGDKVLAIGEDGEERPHIRWRDDLLSAIIYNGDKRDLTLKIQPNGSDSPRLVQVRPSVHVIKQKATRAALIGMEPAPSVTLPDEEPTLPGSAAERASVDGNGFLPGDTILKLAVVHDDQTVTDEIEVSDVHSMRRFLAIHNDQTVRFTVRRSHKKEVVSFDVGTNPMKDVGLKMKFGPIVAIQDDSPAQVAGLKIDDQLVSIDGEPITDGLAISQQLRSIAQRGEIISLGFTRNGAQQEVAIKPVLPYSTRTFSVTLDQRIAVDELGVSFVITDEVASVTPGSSAEKVGIQPGDMIRKIEFIAASKEKKKIEEEKHGFGAEQNEIDMTETPNLWPKILTHFAEYRLPDTRMIVHFERNGKTEKGELAITNAENMFHDTRGIRMSMQSEIHKATSLAEAVQLGFRQTKEDSSKIYGLLYKLFNGEVSPMNLGGPGTIAQAGTYEALGGTSKFLLFLTLLSANLAVVNFLPIPVLDGGHMVFLIYEAIFRRPVGEKLQVALSVMGLIFIIGLMVMVIGLDIWRAFV